MFVVERTTEEYSIKKLLKVYPNSHIFYMYIKVRVIAKAKKETIEQVSSDHYKISVREPAERNLANRRILDIFRSEFPGQDVRLVSGHHSPSKIVSISPSSRPA